MKTTLKACGFLILLAVAREAKAYSDDQAPIHQYYTLDMYGYISYMGTYDSKQQFLNTPIKCYCVK